MENIELRCLIAVDNGGYHWEHGKLKAISGVDWEGAMSAFWAGQHDEAEPSEDVSARFYDAFQEADCLFAEFGYIDPIDEATVLNFANEYGAILPTMKGWRTYIKTLRFAIDFWQLQQAESNEWRQLVREEWAEFEQDRPDVAKATGLRTLKDRGHYLLRQYVTGTLTNTRFDMLPDRGLVLLVRRPIEVVQLQLARAIVAEKTLRRCLWCQNFLLIDHSARRSTRQYCSKSCANMYSRKQRMLQGEGTAKASGVGDLTDGKAPKRRKSKKTRQV